MVWFVKYRRLKVVKIMTLSVVILTRSVPSSVLCFWCDLRTLRTSCLHSIALRPCTCAILCQMDLGLMPCKCPYTGKSRGTLLRLRTKCRSDDKWSLSTGGFVCFCTVVWHGEKETDTERDRERDRERWMWLVSIQYYKILQFATTGSLTDSRGQKTSRHIFSILTQCLSHSFALPDLLLCVKIQVIFTAKSQTPC